MSSSQLDSNNAVTEKPRHKKPLIVRWAVAVLFILIVAGFVGAFLFGYAYAGVKEPSQQVLLQYKRVCGSDMVDKYNKTGAPLSDQDLQTMKELITSIDNNVNSIHDPTCQAIKFYAAWAMNDISKMKDALGVIKTLHSQGSFIDSELRSSTSTVTMELVLDGAQPGAQ